MYPSVGGYGLGFFPTRFLMEVFRSDFFVYSPGIQHITYHLTDFPTLDRTFTLRPWSSQLTSRHWMLRELIWLSRLWRTDVTKGVLLEIETRVGTDIGESESWK
jgi:hypothetical protein